MSQRVYIVGDIHGQMERIAALLYSAGLVSAKGEWAGGDARLLFVGDFLDRGPYGIEAIEFVMGLQAPASAHGGAVDALLGNHDLLALGSVLFRGAFLANHRRNGGTAGDLRRLSAAHAAWLAERPALLRIGSHLIAHADTNHYLKYGRTITQVNRRIATILASREEPIWKDLLEDLSDRHTFDRTGTCGTSRLVPFLATFGARMLVHGHTPICFVTGQSPAEVTEPFVYGDGRAINVDGGLYLGGKGFLYRFETPAIVEPAFAQV